MTMSDEGWIQRQARYQASLAPGFVGRTRPEIPVASQSEERPEDTETGAGCSRLVAAVSRNRRRSVGRLRGGTRRSRRRFGGAGSRRPGRCLGRGGGRRRHSPRQSDSPRVPLVRVAGRALADTDQLVLSEFQVVEIGRTGGRTGLRPPWRDVRAVSSSPSVESFPTNTPSFSAYVKAQT